MFYRNYAFCRELCKILSKRNVRGSSQFITVLHNNDNFDQVGQRIIEVNGQSLLGATHQEAVAILR